VADKNVGTGASSLQPPSTGMVQKPIRSPSGFLALSELTDQFCADLLTQTGPAMVYLDRAAIKDLSTGDVANFSRYLEQELDSSCSEKGFVHVYDPAEADYLLGAVFQQYQQRMRIFLKYHHTDSPTRKSLDYEIESNRLPEDSFKENLKNKAHVLALQLTNNQKDKRVYLKPVLEGTELYVSDFSKSFTERIKNELVRAHAGLTIIDETVIKDKLSRTRALKKKAGTVKNLSEADAELTGAEAILSGKYFIEGDLVVVHMNMTNLDGRLLNTAQVEIKRKYIHSHLRNEKKEVLAKIADKKTEQHKGQVHISTSRGGDYPIYHNGENMVFHIQVAEPLYVYLYDIDSQGKVSLLYPFTHNARQSRLQPGVLYTIPSDDDDFVLEVEYPFGNDAVKVFASAQPLPIPGFSPMLQTRGFTRSGTRAIGVKRKEAQQLLAKTSRINPRDLVDYYRGKAERAGILLYEDSFMLETRR